MVSVENIEQVDTILIYDDQGAGRCHVGRYFVKDRLQNLIPLANFIAAGLRCPDSGSKIIHPFPAKFIEASGGGDVSNDPIHVCVPEDITIKTIALGLTSTPPPDFLREIAFDILVAPARDPFVNLEKEMIPVANQIYLISYLFAYVLVNKFEELGKFRDERGLVLPRNLQVLAMGATFPATRS